MSPLHVLVLFSGTRGHADSSGCARIVEGERLERSEFTDDAELVVHSSITVEAPSACAAAWPVTHRCAARMPEL